VIRILTIAMAIIAGCTQTSKAFSTGWVEVKPSNHQSIKSNAWQAHDSDQLYLPKGGETFEMIAQMYTGNPNNAALIAQYNGLTIDAIPKLGQLILIPASLATGKSAQHVQIQKTQQTRNPETLGSAATDTRLAAVKVISKNIDMFVGQVKVMGRVQVRRVAVGNGKILRAEVLDSGELLVIAQNAGSSSIRLWNKDGSQSDYNIRVSQDDPETRFHMEKT